MRPTRRIAVAVVVSVAILLAWATVHLKVLTVYQVASASMEPAIHCAAGPGCRSLADDDVLVLRYLGRSPRRGDVVVFRLPDGRRGCDSRPLYVKRIVGLPGEDISARNGGLLVDGHELHGGAWRAAGSASFGARSIARGTYFVLGDNRSVSCDSRDFGAVPRSAIVGRAVARVWPLRRIGMVR
jgi:signal peptidase I